MAKYPLKSTSQSSGDGSVRFSWTSDSEHSVGLGLYVMF